MRVQMTSAASAVMPESAIVTYTVHAPGAVATDATAVRSGGVYGVVFRGRRYDTGDKLSYLKAVVTLASEREDLGPELRSWLEEFVTQL